MERKAIHVADIGRAVSAVRAVLADDARTQGGRVLLYGFAVRGDPRYGNIFELLADFPQQRESAPWRFAEQVRLAHGLEPDIRLRGWCPPAILKRILPEVGALA